MLRGNDLVVREGEFVALMGANGSGKSTLVRALTGLRPLTQGSVLALRHPAAATSGRGTGSASSRSAATRRGRRARQRARGRGVRPADPPRPAASARAAPTGAAIDDALEVVGLTDKAGDSVSTLSGGQQQRVLIARALAGEPDAVLPRRADRRGRPAQPAGPRRCARAPCPDAARPSSWSPTSSARSSPLVDRAVVMRDGRIAYDGPPLSHEDVHGHHHPVDARHDHVPHVGSPFDTLSHPREGGR